jgi:hypothetical protein
MPAVVISVEAARIHNAILPEYLTSEVAREDPEIRSTESNIPIDNNCRDDELHFVIPGASGDFEDEGDKGNAISTTSRRRWAATVLVKLDLATGVVDRYEGEDGDDLDVYEEAEVSQADDGSTQNVED